AIVAGARRPPRRRPDPIWPTYSTSVRTSTASSGVPRSSSHPQNSSTSKRYARRVVSASAGESRKRAAAPCESIPFISTPSLASCGVCPTWSRGAEVGVAPAAVYVIWGSPSLGIELAGETIPPLFAVGVRFLCAAALLFAFTAWKRGGEALRVTRRELASCVLIGALLPGANAILFIAERHVPTGLASLIIGAVPLWIVVMRTLNGDRPERAALFGVVFGFAGLVILVRPSGHAPLWALLLVVVSSVMWATGSYLSG